MKPEQGTRIEMGGQVKLNSNRCIRKRKAKKRDFKREDFPICMVLQELYSSCKAVFKSPGVVPSSSDVQSICRIMDRMEPEDLGLSKDLQFFNPASEFNENRRVTCTNIYRCNNFSLVMFFLPASAVIPLHNHPDMTVFSKLLYGQMHVKSYDWEDSVDIDKKQSGQRLAKLKADTVLNAPCETKVLFPTTGGNMHEFTALTPCVVLDVLGPPYSIEDDRDCTYYRDLPFDANKETELKGSLQEDAKYAWLEEIEMPESSRMNGIRYLGPQIIENIW